MDTVDYIWMKGEFVRWEDAKIHVLTHGLHYGYGVFEGIRAYETTDGRCAVFRLTDHMRRLERSAKIYLMPMAYTAEELAEATKELIRRNKITSCYIRPIVYSGEGNMGLNPIGMDCDTAIAVWGWGAYLGDEGIANGVRVKISSWRRFDHNAIPPAAKACGNYLNSIMSKMEAVHSGYEEAIMLNPEGYVCDGSGENVFVINNGVMRTPPFSSGPLEGITRDTAVTIARDLGIEVREEDLVRTDLYNCDEAFFTGTAAEIVPIRSVDDREIGDPGPVTCKIQETFFSVIKGEVDEYRQWLEYV